MKSLFCIDGYLAVIPKIQNIYFPEKVETGYQWGFKYESGVFEFFTLKTMPLAREEYDRLAVALDNYWDKGIKP